MRSSTNKNKEQRVGLTYVQVRIRNFTSSDEYEGQFLVDTGETDSLVPEHILRGLGIEPVGNKMYELANGEVVQFPFGLVEISFMDEVTAGRVIFGPPDSEPLLAVTALESAGVTLDLANRTLRKLPAIKLKPTL